MNPEFQRNLWLELTPLRLVVLAAGLVLVFFAAALTNGPAGPAEVARWGYYFFAVIWGTRSASRAVVGEIRERTWDFQRLSSITPASMMWGKLFGATIFAWAGALVCLIVLLADVLNHAGAVAALIQLGYYIAIGLIAQAASLLASLIAIGRRQGRRQFEAFFYQLIGIAAAAVVVVIADPAGPAFGYIPHSDVIAWWNLVLPTQGFLLASLAVFAGWILIGNYRLMRLELKLSNGPWIWLSFLVFVALYVGGFDAWASVQLPNADAICRRIYLTALVTAVLAYGNIFLEAKTPVFFRWFGAEIGHGHVGRAFYRVPRWMAACLLTLALGIALVVRLHMSGWGEDEAYIGAMLGFMTRDLGVIVLMNLLAPRRGSDLAALAVLLVLYAVMPAIIAGLQYSAGAALFLPRQTDPLWLSPAVAWVEAAVAWAITVTNIVLPKEASQKD